MVKHGGQRYRGRRESSGGSMLATKPKFVAPIVGHEDVYFTTGSTKDAAAFQDTVLKLARHVSTAPGYKQGPTLSKAMTDLRDPQFDQPTRPVRKYCQNTDNAEKKDRATGGKVNVEVMDDLDYAIETGEYSRKISRYETQLKVWGDNNAKGYALVLRHCPEELQAELKNQEVWTAIDNARSVVCLLVLIRDLQYNKSDRKRSIMATVEADLDLYLCAQGKKITDEYYKIFTSTVDTINTNTGNAGLHPSVFKKYLSPMMDIQAEKTDKELSELTPIELKEVEDKATEAANDLATGKYLTCLFLLLADDDRYGSLKTQLNNNNLMGEQEYPSDILWAK